MYEFAVRQDAAGCHEEQEYDAFLFRNKACKSGVLDFDIVRMGEDEFLATIHTPKRGGVLLATPRASGFAVLELSKVHMLKVHYDYYKKTYGDKAKLYLQTRTAFAT